MDSSLDCSIREVILDNETQLSTVGMSSGSAAGQVVRLHDCPWKRLSHEGRLSQEDGDDLRSALAPSPTSFAWGRPPAPRHPPGLPAPTLENARLWDLIPNSQQSWPAEYKEFDARYAAALQPAPSFTIISAGGPIRRPSPTPPPASSPLVSPMEATARTSCGVFVELGSYFTAGGLRNSKIRFPPRAANMTNPRAASSSTHSTEAVVIPHGSVFYQSQLSAVAPVFVPHALEYPSVPRHGATTTTTTGSQSALTAQAYSAGFAKTVDLPSPASAALLTGFLSNDASAGTASAIPAVNLATPRVVVNLPPVAVDTAAVDGADLRMVVIRYVPTWTTLQELSMSVSSGLYGAVYSIRFWMEHRQRVAEVIFRDPYTIDSYKSATPGALGYFTALTDAANKEWDERNELLWPFPQGWSITPSLELFPSNDCIRSMRFPRQRIAAEHQENNELATAEPAGQDNTELGTAELGAAQSHTPRLSRRISLVGREGLFNRLRERELMNILLRGRTISASRIERVCIYNSGNATIVFADVDTAVAAIKRFEEYNGRKPPLKRVEASFSKCPCEVLVHYAVDPMYIGHLEANPRY
ncbi:hypothetical protein VE03_05255 [Pseudogymnoascus sp. 23342-1-I1]|nr:hypothetical protein VE03_05255 [Pseudogymnoascus sp. 23342-1-I1]